MRTAMRIETTETAEEHAASCQPGPQGEGVGWWRDPDEDHASPLVLSRSEQREINRMTHHRSLHLIRGVLTALLVGALAFVWSAPLSPMERAVLVILFVQAMYALGYGREAPISYRFAARPVPRSPYR